MATLFNIDKTSYGHEYNNHVLQQYKLYCESAEKVSDRRQNANSYFITINTALITLIGLSFQINVLKGNVLFRTLLSFVGIVICAIFWFLLNSYKQLNTGKYSVIHQIEQKLPLASYDCEWEALGKGKDKKKYYPFSHIELLVPWVFSTIYIALGLICIFSR